MVAVLGFVAAMAVSNAPILVGGEYCHPRNLLVRYSSDTVLTSLKRVVPIERVIPEIHCAVVQAPVRNLLAAQKQLKLWPGVAAVDLDRCARPAYDPNDSLYPNQWDMRAMRANYAWDSQKGSSNVIIAVIDTGVFTGHPDIAPNIWVNPGEIPGNNIDDDGDGYIDDVNGYDFSHNDGTPDDVFGHGTSCSGLVAAVQDNTIGISGVAPNCKVMALKAATDDGYFYDSNNVAAYIFAANHGAKVLSMSFYSDRVSQSERDAIDYCWAHGVLPVCAAGNAASVFPFYPGAYEHVLAVAAVDGNLNKAGFSNYGSWVNVSAPGTGLYTITNSGGYTSGFAGTSGACPHVAGLAALCFSANPNATNQDVRNAIEDTATMQNQAPYGEFANYGFVNSDMAVMRMNNGPVAAHPSVVRYLSGYGLNVLGAAHKPPVRIYGRGLDSNVAVTAGGRHITPISLHRDYIEVSPDSLAGVLSVKVNGSEIAGFTLPTVSALTYPLAEASTQNATLTGGFLDTLAADGQVMSVTRQSDGSILLQGTFKVVNPKSTAKITLRRRYTGTTVGTETVQLYDWSTGSYPYGGFVTIGTTAVPTAFTTSSFNVSNAARFVDPEGTMYLLISTSTNLASGAKLELDLAKAE